MTNQTPAPRHRRLSAAQLRRRGAEPTLARYGPNLTEAALRVQAEQVTADLADQRDRWRSGFSRRKLLAGTGGIGVAALGAQLVTTRVAFADPATTNRALVVVFLRGGMDGLSAVVPAGDQYLLRARPSIGVPEAALLPGDSRFGLHPALLPLQPFWKAGTMAAVHAVSTPDASRSHFQAQDCLERGTGTNAISTGWLDRALTAIGPGTTFRAISEGDAMPRSMVGVEHKLVINGIEGFSLANADGVRDKTLTALKALYTGFDHPVAVQAQATVKALGEAHRIAEQPYQPVQPYPGGGFSDQLRDVARLLKAKVGLRVAAIDVGGWDMHTGVGRPDGGQMKDHLGDLAGALAAFATDLGPALADVTVVTMTEFGRRVEQNGNDGLDHGHGGLMLLLGGGLNGGKVHGKWPGLAPSALDQGDLAGANDYRDVLAEALATRFGVANVKPVFPDHPYQRLGVFR